MTPCSVGCFCSAVSLSSISQALGCSGLVLAWVFAGRLSVWIPRCQPTMSHADPNMHLAHYCFISVRLVFSFLKKPIPSDSLIIKSSLEIRKKKKKTEEQCPDLFFPSTCCAAENAQSSAELGQLRDACLLKAPPDLSFLLLFLLSKGCRFLLPAECSLSCTVLCCAILPTRSVTAMPWFSTLLHPSARTPWESCQGWAVLTYLSRSAKSPKSGTCPTTNSELFDKHVTVSTAAVLRHELKCGSSGVTDVSVHSVPGVMGATLEQGWRNPAPGDRQSVCPDNVVCTGLCHFCHQLRWCLAL